MELQTFYLQLAIFVYGILSGFSNGAEDHASIESTEIDHYNQSYPVALNHTYISVNAIKLLWSMPGNMENYTSELYNFIVYHHKRVHKGNAEKYTNASVPPNETTYEIDNLEPGTKYSFYVVANYTTGQQPASHTFTYTTNGYGPDRPCACQLIGSVDNNCDRNTGKCKCRGDGYADRRCEACQLTYYWHTRLGCQPCPKCNMNNSNGSCYVDKASSNQVLCRCNNPWGGAKCEHCAKGYFMVKSTGKCAPCKCNNNTENKSNLCHYKTGVCESCKYNTTGDNCEKCLPGYEGDAVIGRNCTLLGPTEVTPRKGGVIVGVCVALFIIVIVVISVGICRRVRGRKPKFNFWTVELKDDHEQKRHGRSYIYVPNGDRTELIEGELFSDDGTE